MHQEVLFWEILLTTKILGNCTPAVVMAVLPYCFLPFVGLLGPQIANVKNNSR